MTPQETELLNEFLAQLVQVRGITKDSTAESLIAKAVTQQPDAAYLLVQRSLLQDQALEAAKQQIESLQSELRNARAPAAVASTNSFLGGGNAWGRKPLAAASPVAAGMAASPVMARPTAAPLAAQQAAGAGGSGFLSRAAATAAGVVGGAFLFQGISHLLGNHGNNTAASNTPASAQDTSQAAADGLVPNSFAEEPAPSASSSYADSNETFDTAYDDQGGGDDSFA